jgi:hypothetical protein
MALIVHFSPVGMDRAKYDEVIRRLVQAGAGAPPGRLHHCCYDPGNGELRVVDLFDSEKSFEEFGKTLVPILTSVGIDVGQPTINGVHNVIRG